MKLLVFTDNHSLYIEELLAKAKMVDIIISLGDISLMGKHLEEQFKLFNSLGKPFLYIDGNHEDHLPTKKICAQYSNIIHMHNRTKVFGNLIIVGHGGGGFAQRDDAFEKIAPLFGEEIKKYPVSIFIHHMPPYNTELDYLTKYEPQPHRGSKSYREFIDKFQPTYALSGHFHETFGVMQKIGKTTYLNPGDSGEIIDV